MKYLVSGYQIINPTYVVYAESEEEAVQLATEGKYDSADHRSQDNAEGATNTKLSKWSAEQLEGME